MSRALRLLFALSALSLVACSSPPPPPSEPPAAPEPPPRRWGDMMTEVGRRFERIGQAGAAGNWGLASYDADELDEVFEEDFPRALAPAAVHAMGTTFGETQLHALHAAIDSHDDATFRRVFAETAAQCNACHVLGERGMIRVPTTPGESVPVIAPEPAPTTEPAPTAEPTDEPAPTDGPAPTPASP